MMNIAAFNKLHKGTSTHYDTKILIVDDEPAIAQTTKTILKLEGLDSHTVHGGFAAIQELHSNKYELVLLDLNMPDLGGEEVLDHINRNNLSTNVIIISGESELKTAIKSLKNGAKDFIRKPFSPEELLFSIKNVLEKSNLQRENQAILEKLEESESLHRFLVHNSPDLLFMLDHNGNFAFANKSTNNLLGYETSEIIGKHYREVVYSEDLILANQLFDKGNHTQSTQNQELRLQCKDRKTIIYAEVRTNKIEKSFSSMHQNSKPKQNFIGTYGVARDISASKKAEQTIDFQIHHDLLTGLPNRISMNVQLADLMSRTDKNGAKFALLFININRFKLVNDTYGRCVGDALLQKITQILHRYSRENDTLARLSGDEFILIIDNIGAADNAITAAKKIVEATTLSFNLDGNEVHISTSVGIAIYPTHGKSRVDLLKNADTALYNAKNKSQNNYCIYNKNLNNKNSKTVEVENLIRNAIKADRFLILYQPQVDPFSGKIHAVEALVRITDAVNGSLIPPGQFIDIAEETSLINDIGEIVLEKVCQDKRDWSENGIPLQVCINISARQLFIENFADHVLDKLHLYDINPAEIELELTENTFVKHIDRTISNLAKLTTAGVKIAIDDFGTGYSSLSYLNQLPLNTLKLDRSFMQKITAKNMNDTIIPAMIAVSSGLQLDFIAEGVETMEQHEYLLKQGTCIAQGFFYSKPIYKTELLDYINKHGIK